MAKLPMYLRDAKKSCRYWEFTWFWEKENFQELKTRAAYHSSCGTINTDCLIWAHPGGFIHRLPHTRHHTSPLGDQDIPCPHQARKTDILRPILRVSLSL